MLLFPAHAYGPLAPIAAQRPVLEVEGGGSLQGTLGKYLGKSALFFCLARGANLKHNDNRSLRHICRANGYVASEGGGAGNQENMGGLGSWLSMSCGRIL